MNDIKKPATRDDLTEEERGQYTALCERMDEDEALEWIAADRRDLACLRDEAESR